MAILCVHQVISIIVMIALCTDVATARLKKLAVPLLFNVRITEAARKKAEAEVHAFVTLDTRPDYIYEYLDAKTPPINAGIIGNHGGGSDTVLKRPQRVDKDMSNNDNKATTPSRAKITKTTVVPSAKENVPRTNITKVSTTTAANYVDGKSSGILGASPRIGHGTKSKDNGRNTIYSRATTASTSNSGKPSITTKNSAAKKDKTKDNNNIVISPLGKSGEVATDAGDDNDKISPLSKKNDVLTATKRQANNEKRATTERSNIKKIISTSVESKNQAKHDDKTSKISPGRKNNDVRATIKLQAVSNKSISSRNKTNNEKRTTTESSNIREIISTGAENDYSIMTLMRRRIRHRITSPPSGKTTDRVRNSTKTNTIKSNTFGRITTTSRTKGIMPSLKNKANKGKSSTAKVTNNIVIDKDSSRKHVDVSTKTTDNTRSSRSTIISNKALPSVKTTSVSSTAARSKTKTTDRSIMTSINTMARVTTGSTKGPSSNNNFKSRSSTTTSKKNANLLSSIRAAITSNSNTESRTTVPVSSTEKSNNKSSRDMPSANFTKNTIRSTNRKATQRTTSRINHDRSRSSSTKQAIKSVKVESVPSAKWSKRPDITKSTKLESKRSTNAKTKEAENKNAESKNMMKSAGRTTSSSKIRLSTKTSFRTTEKSNSVKKRDRSTTNNADVTSTKMIVSTSAQETRRTTSSTTSHRSISSATKPATTSVEVEPVAKWSKRSDITESAKPQGTRNNDGKTNGVQNKNTGPQSIMAGGKSTTSSRGNGKTMPQSTSTTTMKTTTATKTKETTARTKSKATTQTESKLHNRATSSLNTRPQPASKTTRSTQNPKEAAEMKTTRPTRVTKQEAKSTETVRSSSAYQTDGRTKKVEEQDTKPKNIIGDTGSTTNGSDNGKVSDIRSGSIPQSTSTTTMQARTTATQTEETTTTESTSHTQATPPEETILPKRTSTTTRSTQVPKEAVKSTEAMWSSSLYQTDDDPQIEDLFRRNVNKPIVAGLGFSWGNTVKKTAKMLYQEPNENCNNEKGCNKKTPNSPNSGDSIMPYVAPNNVLLKSKKLLAGSPVLPWNPLQFWPIDFAYQPPVEILSYVPYYYQPIPAVAPEYPIVVELPWFATF